jgi:hypothetical protein
MDEHGGVNVLEGANRSHLSVADKDGFVLPVEPNEFKRYKNFEDGKTLFSIVPDGITVTNNSYGKCLVATRKFVKNEFMYAAYYLLLDDPSTYSYLKIKDTKYEISTVHSVMKPNGQRELFGFDGFMNHSCDPNVICPHVPRLPEHEVKTDHEDRVYYYTYALKDIEIGDEVVCDYAVFDYTCDGHEIEQCLCGAANCRGNMKGKP